MTQAIMSLRSGTQKPPSLRTQMQLALELYRTLTNIYFVSIEARASTSSTFVRNSCKTHMSHLQDILLGESDDQDGLENSLQPVHVQELMSLTIVEQVLSAQNNTPPIPTIPQVTDALRKVDQITTQLLNRARKHAKNQDRIRQLVTNIDERNTELVGSIRSLAQLSEQTRALVRAGEREEAVMARAEERECVDKEKIVTLIVTGTDPLSYEEILQYARTLSQTTTAPPGFRLNLEGYTDEQGDKAEQSLKEQDRQEGQEGQSAMERIPPHLHDKLPFPSVDAMRRSASQVPTPTWTMFQRGMEAESPARPEPEAAVKESSRTVRPMPPEPVARPKAPVEEEDEGFGLDLN